MCFGPNANASYLSHQEQGHAFPSHLSDTDIRNICLANERGGPPQLLNPSMARFKSADHYYRHRDAQPTRDHVRVMKVRRQEGTRLELLVIFARYMRPVDPR